MKFRRSGQSLIEVIIVLALFLLISVGVIGALSSSLGASKRGSDTIAATGYVKEAVEAVRSIRDRDWSEVTAGTYGLDTGAGYYEFQGSGDTLGPNNSFTRTIQVEDVTRSPGLQGDISSSGVDDPNSKKVNVSVAWDLFAGQPRTVSETFYVFNYDAGAGQSWVQNTNPQFQAGFENSTDVGSVLLREVNADWSEVSEFHSIDLSGNGDRIASHYDEAQDVLYVLSRNTAGNELVALDVSDVSESTPTIIGGYDTGGVTPNDLAVKDGYGYIASSSNTDEVQVVDLDTMAQVNSIDLIGTTDATAVDYVGDRLIVGRNNNTNPEVYLYNIANPTGSITQVDTTEIGTGINVMATDDAYAYLGTADGSNEIYVVRASDGSQVNSRNLPGFAPVEGMALRGTNLYVGRQNFGGGSDEFLLLDISNPEGTISIPQSLNLSYIVNDITIDDGEDYAFLATSDVNGEGQIIDLATFSNTQTADMDTFVEGFSVEQFGGYIYLGSDDASNDLTIFHTGSPGWDTTLIGSANPSGPEDGLSVAVDGNYAYVGREDSNPRDEFIIYDITNPASPSQVGSFDTDADINEIVISGNYAYLATESSTRELDIIDISNKSAPSRAGSLDAPGSEAGLSVAVDGNTAYLGREYSFFGNPFHVIDVTNPAGPTLTGTLSSGSPFTEFIDLIVDGNEVYAVNTLDWTDQDIYVIDVSTPAAPSTVTTIDPSGFGDGTAIDILDNTLAFVRFGGSPNDVVFIDISTPSSPSETGAVDVGDNVNDIVLEDEDYMLLVTTENNAEFQRWRITNISNPEKTDEFDLGRDGRALVYDGTNAHVATESNSAEYQIVGPSGAPVEYASEGAFTSQAFDSSQVGTTWSSIEWVTSGSGSVEFRVRTADTQSNLQDATWVGPDGTAATSYDTSGQAIMTDPGASGTQWVQWKAYLTGTSSNTPSVEEVTLFY
jgi:type II secretory pathway pseudopilin PulG